MNLTHFMINYHRRMEWRDVVGRRALFVAERRTTMHIVVVHDVIEKEGIVWQLSHYWRALLWWRQQHCDVGRRSWSNVGGRCSGHWNAAKEARMASVRLRRRPRWRHYSRSARQVAVQEGRQPTMLVTTEQMEKGQATIVRGE